MVSIFKKVKTSASLMAIALVLNACATTGQTTRNGTSDTATASSGSRSDIAERLVRMGDRAVARDDQSSAVLLYGQALSEGGEDAEIAVKLGDALYTQGRASEALEVYRGVLASEPDHADASHGFAKVQIAMDRPTVAIDQIERALRNHDDDARLWTTLGVARDLDGQHAQARVAYDRALAIEPADLSARNNRALSLAFDGYEDEAIEELRTITEGSEANPRSRQNLAFVYALAGDLERARQLSYVDLSEAAVENNLDYFSRLDVDERRNPRALRPITSASASAPDAPTADAPTVADNSSPEPTVDAPAPAARLDEPVIVALTPANEAPEPASEPPMAAEEVSEARPLPVPEAREAMPAASLELDGEPVAPAARTRSLADSLERAIVVAQEDEASRPEASSQDAPLPRQLETSGEPQAPSPHTGETIDVDAVETAAGEPPAAEAPAIEALELPAGDPAEERPITTLEAEEADPDAPAALSVPSDEPLEVAIEPEPEPEPVESVATEEASDPVVEPEETAPPVTRRTISRARETNPKVLKASPIVEPVATSTSASRLSAREPRRVVPTATSSTARVVQPGRTTRPQTRERTPVGVADTDNNAAVAIVEPDATPVAPTELPQSISAPEQMWVLDLGQYDGEAERQAVWTRLVNDNPDMLERVERLRGSDAGPQPLLAGPITQESRAVAICAVLNARAIDCEPKEL